MGRIWMLLGLAVLAVTVSAETIKPARAFIPFFAETVLLDGQMAEAVWQKAARLEGFWLVGRGKAEKPTLATQPTLVQVFYNAEAIFLGISAREAAVEKINRSTPGEEGYGDAPLEWSGDLIEIFVKPGEKAPVYHLAFNPNGARWDSSSASSVSWSGNWQVATRVTEEGWQAEVCLPFACLAERGNFAGTANPGECWKVNICRAERPFSEFSTWSYSPTLFGNESAFGSFLFQGRTATDPRIRLVDPGSLLAGKNELTLELDNPSGNSLELEVVLRLSQPAARPAVEEKDVAREKLVLRGQSQARLKLPYIIQQAGFHRLSCSVYLPSVPVAIFTGAVGFEIYPLPDRVREFKEIQQEISRCLQQVKPGTAGRAQWQKTWAGLKAELEKLYAEVGKTGVNQSTIAEAMALEKNLFSFRKIYTRRIRPSVWLQKSQRPGAVFAVAEEYSGVKIFQDEPVAARLTENVKISLAGGESESRQLVLLPVIDTPVQVLVKTSDLVSGQQILPASQISFHRVGYLRIKEAPVGTRGGYWPDPLFPVNSLDLKDEPEVILLTVHAERNQPAGTYRGSLSFDTPEGKPVQKLDLVVEVFPFSLPERSPFRMDFWFSEHHIAAIYRQPLTPEFFRSCMEVMGQYRLAAYPQLPTVMRNVVIYLENDGELTFDFRGLEPYLKAATEHGLNFINISFTNHYQSLVHQFEKITAVRRDNGEKVTILVTSPEQLTRKFLKEVTEYVLERGWFTREEIYCDVIDEPWNEPARQALKKAAAAVREAVPFARIYGAGTYKGMGVDGFIDTWVPQLRQFQPENYQPGDEVWLYQCLYKVPFPTFTLNRPGLEVRTQFWINWKYRITGFLYWSSIYWGTSRDYSQLNQRPVRDFFVHPEWPVPFDGTDYVGDALFFYPGPQGLLPGLRAVNIRDGVEDWEYLYLLGKLMEEAKKAGVAVPEELMKESQSLLKVPEEAVASPRKFTDSPEMIEKTREKVAKLIIRWGKLLSTTRRGR